MNIVRLLIAYDISVFEYISWLDGVKVILPTGIKARYNVHNFLQECLKHRTYGYAVFVAFWPDLPPREKKTIIRSSEKHYLLSLVILNVQNYVLFKMLASCYS